MDFAALVAQYGYLALFIGCLLEGESMLFLAGSLIHAQQLSFYLALPIALFGGFCGDLGFFLLGRYAAKPILTRFPRLKPAVDKTLHRLAHHDAYLIIAVRFMYGFRIAGPIAIGMSKVSFWRFVGFNLLGALLWALIFLSLGYLLGQSLQTLLHKYSLKIYLLTIIAIIFMVLLILHFYRSRNKPK